MNLVYIDSNKVGTFQCCCIIGCDLEAVAEVKKQTSDGVLYLAHCDTHCIPEEVALKTLNSARIFIQPNGEDKKTRWDLWKKYTPQKERADTTTESEWCWIENFEHWMLPTLEIKSLKELKNAELINAANQIVKANYVTPTRRVSWVTKLTKPKINKNNHYPTEKLKVGTRLALEKLDEMLEEAEGRRLL